MILISHFTNIHMFQFQLKRRPCTFGQFLWSTNFFLVDQKPISHFFGRPIFFLVNQKTILSCFWSTNFFFGQPNLFLANQKKNWLTKKVRNRPDNWSTKRLTKTTWTRLKYFFGQPNFFLVYQSFFLVYQKKIWSTKKIRNWPDNWYIKETDQKYMDAALVYQRDWPKVHGRRLCIGDLLLP